MPLPSSSVRVLFLGAHRVESLSNQHRTDPSVRLVVCDSPAVCQLGLIRSVNRGDDSGNSGAITLNRTDTVSAVCVQSSQVCSFRQNWGLRTLRGPP